MFVARAPSIFGHLKLTAPPLWLVVVLPLAYFTAAYISLSLFGANTPLWMSNAFVVAALLRNKRSTWPVLLGLGALADYAVNFVQGMPILALGIVVCDSTEIILVSALAGFTETTSLSDSIWPMARLGALCIFVPMISAAGGATLSGTPTACLTSKAGRSWYLATASGLLTITPLLLSWTDLTFWTAGRAPCRIRDACALSSCRGRRLFRFP